jgi:UDP:flavonoid glycosyltransferase YjiC (YdhE family)
VASDDFDIVFVADARFSGGTSTALATEIRAAAKAGIRSALLHVRGPVLRRPYAFHPELRAAIDAGEVAWADPARRIECRAVIVHHPTLFPKPLAQRLNIRASHAVLVAHHPPFNGEGKREYDVEKQIDSIAQSFGIRPSVAPVGPAVRAQFANMPGVPLTRSDWYNLIDREEWPARPFRTFGSPIVIGRHSRPDPLKWPDTREEILAAYPDTADFHVRALGCDGFLEKLLGGITPRNWECLPFGAESPQEFLRSLDAYVYFHSAKWVEAFGRGPLEAFATGLPVVLPEHFRPLFGDAAIYGEPKDIPEILNRLRDDPVDLKEQRDKGLAMVRDKFSADLFAPRVRDLFGIETRTKPRAANTVYRTQRSVMFVSSNGVGLGHLTRQMAVARRLPASMTPIFFTLSRAASLVRDAGYLVEHAMFHRYAQTDPNLWNPVFAEELAEALLFHKPAALVFDGNVPYSGLLQAMATRPDMKSIWIRRAMWRHHHKNVLPRADKFDAIVEPGELAGADDDGPTAATRRSVLLADPVIMIRPEDRLPREEARRALGVNDGKLLVAFQVGSGNNFDFGPIRHALLTALVARRDVEVIEIVSPITERAEPLERFAESHRIVSLFPSFRLSNAFDCAVSAAGYNSFHENVLGGVPTLFVPNEAEEMDKQATRAQFADRNNLARWISARDIYATRDKTEELLDPDVRAGIREACANLTPGDGAGQIARFIEETTLAIRSMV